MMPYIKSYRFVLFFLISLAHTVLSIEDYEAACASTDPAPELVSGIDWGGKTLKRGIYKSTAAVGLTGELILDDDDDGAIGTEWVFCIGAAFTTAASSKMTMTVAGKSANVHWIVTGAITLGAGSVAVGSMSTPVAMTVGAGNPLTFDPGSPLVTFKIGGALTISAGATMALKTAYEAVIDEVCSLPVGTPNVQWVASGAITVGAGATVVGSLTSTVGAIALGAGASGCDLDAAGAIALGADSYAKSAKAGGAVTKGAGAVLGTDPVADPCSDPSGIPITGAIYPGGTIAPGIYTTSDPLGLTGELILDLAAGTGSEWFFCLGADFTTAANSKMIMAGDGKSANVHWIVTGAITLGINSVAVGRMTASKDMTMNRGTHMTFDASDPLTTFIIGGALTIAADCNMVSKSADCAPPNSPPNVHWVVSDTIAIGAGSTVVGTMKSMTGDIVLGKRASSRDLEAARGIVLGEEAHAKSAKAGGTVTLGAGASSCDILSVGAMSLGANARSQVARAGAPIVFGKGSYDGNEVDGCTEQLPTPIIGASFGGAGETLAPGTYSAAAAIGLTGDIILDLDAGIGDRWVFCIGAAFTTTAGTKMIMAGGGISANVHWVVTGAISLGTGSVAVGSMTTPTAMLVSAGTPFTFDPSAPLTTFNVGGALTISASAVMALETADGVVISDICSLPIGTPNVQWVAGGAVAIGAGAIVVGSMKSNVGAIALGAGAYACDLVAAGAIALGADAHAKAAVAGGAVTLGAGAYLEVPTA